MPTWLVEEGSMLHDRRDLMGHSVLSSRGRYVWDDGSVLEIEISDVGNIPDDVIFTALGFDLDLTILLEKRRSLRV
ncbi:Unannotated [Lentimonas sp. CC19]|nr:Unannotated [Lentimonas sp. CC10]CAA6691071.1 Unannotated [Lentimonas sp. CC19]CAA7069315.1 Unannotated [Lentimonas sp. CC11]